MKLSPKRTAQDQKGTREDAMKMLVEEVFAAFSNGEIEGFGGPLADDVIYEESFDMAPIRGREAFKEYASLYR